MVPQILKISYHSVMNHSDIHTKINEFHPGRQPEAGA